MNDAYMNKMWSQSETCSQSEKKKTQHSTALGKYKRKFIGEKKPLNQTEVKLKKALKGGISPFREADKYEKQSRKKK